jgi:hypothetical protein
MAHLASANVTAALLELFNTTAQSIVQIQQSQRPVQRQETAEGAGSGASREFRLFVEEGGRREALTTQITYRPTASRSSFLETRFSRPFHLASPRTARIGSSVSPFLSLVHN